jgi:Glycosyl-transferase for dystroglycan
MFFATLPFWLSKLLIFYTLIPTFGCHIVIKKPVREILSKDPKQAIVLPAYQVRYNCKSKNNPTSCHIDKVLLMPRTKLQLLQGLNSCSVAVFDPKNQHGHVSTLYDLWMAQRAGTVAPINCLKSDRYEPYLVVQHCRELPPCQEQFTRYGKNNILVSSGSVVKPFL